MSRIYQSTANQTRTAILGSQRVALIERVIIPTSLLIAEAKLGLPGFGGAAVMEVAWGATATTLGGTPLHVTRQQVLDREILNLGFDHEKLRILFDEVMLRLSGLATTAPVDGHVSDAVARMVEHGTRSRIAFYNLFSYPMLTSELEFTLDEQGLLSPVLHREGGPFTDTAAV